MKEVAEIKLKRILKNPDEVLPAWQNAIGLLAKTGILDYLYAVMQPSRGQKMSMEDMAIEGAYSAGALQILDLLVNFKDLYFLEDPNARLKDIPRDFGGLKAAEVSGDLTKEEIDAIRSGKRPDYSKYLKSPQPTTAGKPSPPIVTT